MTKWLLVAGGLAALACGLYRVSAATPRKDKKTTSFRMRCRSCGRDLLVDSGRHFADPNDSESFDTRVSCPSCGRDHLVAYSPAGAVHGCVLLPAAQTPPPDRNLWSAPFSAN